MQAFEAAGAADAAAPRASRVEAGERLRAVTPPAHKGELATNDPWVVEFRAGEVQVRRLADVRSVRFSREELLAGDDLLVVFDVWAPGCTDRPASDEAGRKRGLRARQLRVESELIKRGGITLHDGGPTGDEGRDALVYWSLSSPENKTGRRSAEAPYTVRVLAGRRSLGSFRLRWGA